MRSVALRAVQVWKLPSTGHESLVSLTCRTKYHEMAPESSPQMAHYSHLACCIWSRDAYPRRATGRRRAPHSPDVPWRSNTAVTHKSLRVCSIALLGGIAKTEGVSRDQIGTHFPGRSRTIDNSASGYHSRRSQATAQQIASAADLNVAELRDVEIRCPYLGNWRTKQE